MALGNHRKSIRAEIAARPPEAARRVQLEALTAKIRHRRAVVR
jgi:hypothetical protein